jgi:hypothetical protein
MAGVTDCHDCGEPEAILIAEEVDDETGAWNGLYLCRACADKRVALRGNATRGSQPRPKVGSPDMDDWERPF